MDTRDRTVTLLTVMLVVSVAFNVGLAYKVGEFTGARNAQVAKSELQRLAPGTAVPPISARRVDAPGAVIETIGYTGTDRPTVLYILSPTCGWCARNESSIKQLIAEKAGEYRFIGISLTEEGAADYASAHRLGVPLYTALGEDEKKAYKMGATPQTIVVSSKGVVLANWNGAFLGKQKDAIEKFFKVSLKQEKRS